jgi:polyisoprenoid-binding protein YceI
MHFMKRAMVCLALCLGWAVAQAPQRLESSSVQYFASAGADKWSGRAPLESLEWQFNLRRPLETEFVATLRPARFDSGNAIRDANARSNVFKVERFPSIVLRSSSLSGERSTLVSGESRTFRLAAKLSIAGISRDLQMPLEVYFDGNTRRLRAEAEFVVGLDDYKLERPEFLWLKVDNAVRLMVQLETIVP